MRYASLRPALAVAVLVSAALAGGAQPRLLARGTLTGSAAGPNRDLSGLSGTLENGVPADLLGGLGSGIAHLRGDLFLAVPDRGPNAVAYNPLVDDTVSYINRVHTLRMLLRPSNAPGGLPFSLEPTLLATTLLASPTPLVYGTGDGLNVPPGRPARNTFFRRYFTGRSDGFDPDRRSSDPNDARLDPESIRVANDGLTFFVSDEYGPYIYEFRRSDGERVRTFHLPESFAVRVPAPTGAAEMAANTIGRTPNKGLEGLAITPNGRKLVAILQAATLQDAAESGAAANVLRIAVLDVATGRTEHQYSYLLTTGSGVSDIVALNNHEFLVDERDGKGLGDGSKAKVKQLFKIDLNHATDVSGLDGTAAAAAAVPKTLFLDLVALFTSNGISADQIPAKIEGLAFGEDLPGIASGIHTLWIANDNDFVQDYSGPETNPNQVFVVGFTDADLGGSVFVPQRPSPFPWD